MFIPLVDVLRCLNQHEETWLVASIERAEDRDIVEGMLGCPICMAEYPVRAGVVEFAEGLPRAAALDPDEGEATRLAAALDLTDPRKTAVLQGGWGAHAPIMRGLTPAQLILVNAPDGVSSGDGVSILLAPTAPLATSSVDAVAVDASASPDMLRTLRAALKGGGRMVGPASMPLPPDLRELTRDDDVWVAEAAPGIISQPILPTRRTR